MKKHLLTLLFFSTFNLFSQETSVSGSIIDFSTKEALSYVNIICKNVQDSIINGTISNEKGQFWVDKLPLGKTTIEIQFIGYKTITKQIHFTSENLKVDLGIQNLQEDTTLLNEVEIQAETTSIVQKIDRRVVNVGKDLSAAGTNALQMMQNIPSVSVNLQSGSVSLRGNENVRVLIDGKPSNLSSSQILKQIPSSSIKSIELITNPSAKHNPEGMSGIINIILKKNTQLGFNGSLTLGVTQGENTRPTGAINLNYRTGKFNFYGNYNVDWGKYETISELSRTDKDLHQQIDFLDDTVDQVIKVGTDIYINDNNTFSIYTTQNLSKTDFTTNTQTIEDNNLILHTPNLSKFDVSESTYNADYKIVLDTLGQSLELEANFTQTKSPEIDTNRELINPSSKLYNYTNNITNNTDSWLINLDYTKPFSDTEKLEFGLESNTQKTFNNIITDQEVETGGTPATTARGNTNFTYDREIYSAYVNYNKDFSKFSLQAGLRFEQFNVEGIFSNTQQGLTAPYIDEIFSVYPSAFLTYFPDDTNEFQLSYSRRVDRPSIEQVSPIQEWTSPLTISTGNQQLAPQFTNSFELNYTRNIATGYLYFGTFFRRVSDQIGRNITIDANNIDRQLISYENYNNSDSYGFEAYASLKPKKWWTFSPALNMYIQDRNGLVNNQNITVENTLFIAQMSNSFKASKKLSFQFSGTYVGKNKTVQFNVDPYYTFNAGAKLSVLKDKGAITLNGTDIFNNLNVSFTSTNPFAQTGYFKTEFRTVYVGFTYNFGSNKFKKRARKKREKNETEGSGGVL
ncbi:outer membrane beta-barrel protein [Tenacibaculum sp. 1_MG-2023]|uniref:outer membrane beta-barrel protein n=1 Tax=Tenacibaculum sp. 1_MG-2023 TaxID=3062653 RepID=UPI0026E3ECB2|nr:outer membrane beta-barrel protein [Tenacibaculum sp. 1_MG-2023]MDO6600017.1 TonB-dependent receptor [Tenacibaculum sp. 1_MG-2023]